MMYHLILLYDSKDNIYFFQGVEPRGLKIFIETVALENKIDLSLRLFILFTGNINGGKFSNEHPV